MEALSVVQLLRATQHREQSFQRNAWHFVVFHSEATAAALHFTSLTSSWSASITARAATFTAKGATKPEHVKTGR